MSNKKKLSQSVNDNDDINKNNKDNKASEPIIKTLNTNNDNNNNNNNSDNENNIKESKVIKKSKVLFQNKHEEVKSMSKVINRSSNLTQSEPEGGNFQNDNNNNNNNNNKNNEGAKSPNKSTDGAIIDHPLQTAQSYPDNIGKFISPLSKAQIIDIHDSASSLNPNHDPDDNSSDDDEDDDPSGKKKKSHFFRSLFTYRVGVIIILSLLVLLSGVGVLFKIFWEHITIVDVIILRWALYLDICIAGYLIVSWIVRGLISLFETTLYLQQHVYYYINGLVRPLSALIWAILVYFTTKPVLQLPSYTDEKMDKYYISLRAVMFISLFYCARVALVKILAARTNRKAFYTSLKKSLLDEELLEQLSTRKATSSHLNHSVSTNLKQKKRMGLTQWIDSIRSRSQLSFKLSNKDFTDKEAKKVAKIILANADRTHKGYIDLDDLKYYVKDKHAQKSFDTFGALNGTYITKYDITKWVLRVIRHRKTLELRLRDHEDIGRVINEIINFFFWILIFLFVLTLYGVDVNVFLVPLGTTILGLSFAFGTTLRNVFESLILIFFVRPFEVGDKVVVGTLDGLIVDRIGILFTTFKSLDGKAVYLPNSTLVVARIENHQRSEEVWVGIDVICDFSTPVEKLYFIESKLDKWVKAQPEKWRPDISLTFVSIDGANLITVKYGGNIIASWQDGKRWRPIKNEFYFKMKELIEDIHLETHLPAQRIQMLPSSGPSINTNNNNMTNEKAFKWPGDL